MTSASAVLLLIAVALTTHAFLPLSAYVTYRRRPDQASLIWLIGMSFWALAGSLTALRPWIPKYFGYEFVWLGAAVSYICMALFFHLQTDPIVRRPYIWWGMITLAILLSACSYFLAFPVHYGAIWMSILVPCVAAYFVYLILKIREVKPHKGLTLMLVVFSVAGLSAIPRLVEFILSSQAYRMDIFQFGWATNFYTFMAIVSPIFLSLAYWTFTLDVATYERREAEHLVEERNQSLFQSADLSVYSACASFAGMFVHDFSNLLQTIQLNIVGIKERLGSQADTLEIRHPIQRLEETSKEASNIVNSIRGLYVQHEPEVQRVPLQGCLAQVISICETEAQSRGVKMHFSVERAHDQVVLASPIMLQRVLLNIIRNSFESLEHLISEGPRVSVRASIQLHHRANNRLLLIEIEDNGAGYPPKLINHLGQAWESQKPNGLGLSLLFSKKLLTLWGGDIEIKNLTGQQTGALTRISLVIDGDDGTASSGKLKGE